MILKPKKIKSIITASTFSPSLCHEVMGLDAMVLDFFNVKFLVSCFTILFHPHQEALTSTIISFLDEAPGCMPRQSGSEPVLSPSSYVLCPFLTASPNILFF